ncbi:MAG: twin-arginine translocase TatA/TatE family subunit [Thermoleophilia bacterium]
MPLAFFQNIGVWEILIILVVVMLLFGTKRLPSMGRSLGKGLREFKESVGDTGRELKQAIQETPDQVKDAYHGASTIPVDVEHRALPAPPVEPVATVARPVEHAAADAPQQPANPA